ncbi:MAG: glycoside hydrolase family 3 N-terminal domain-containing protein [Rubricoccaceae bacterium]
MRPLRPAAARPLAAALAVLLVATGATRLRAAGSPPPAVVPPPPMPVADAPPLLPDLRDAEERLWPGTADWAEQTLARLTLEQKVGQLFVTHAEGTPRGLSADEMRRLTDLVENFHLGGVVFFAGTSARQAELTRRLQARAAIPLLVSMDMETGPGMRLTDVPAFPSQMALGAARDPELAYLMGRAVAQQARAVGVHVNYAPVADVNSNPANPIINVRSFSEDPALVGALSAAYLRGMQDGGLMATAKHFPGHGDTAQDSHARLATVGGARERLEALELAPFRAAIAAGVMSVMTGHLAVPALEPDARLPATLSPRIVTDVLRGELGFGGLVVTDGLDMRGVRERFGVGEVAVRALEAGVDQLLLTRDEYRAREAILAAVRSGRLPESRIDEAARRVLRAKAWAGLAEGPGAPPVPPSTDLLDRSDALAQTIARRSVTLVQDGDGPLPFAGARLPASLHTLILDDGRAAETGRPFADALAARLPGATHRRLGTADRDAAFERALAEATAAEAVVVATFVRVRNYSGRIGLPDRHQRFARDLMRAAAEAGRPVVLVAFGNPYVAQGLPAPAAFVAAYGTGPFEQQAAAEALTGQIAIGGRLPVGVPGHYALGDGRDVPQQALRAGTPAEAGMAPDVAARIDAVLARALEAGAFPGAAVAIGRGGVLVRLRGYGALAPGGEPVSPETLYDLASLTKVVGTTTAVMQLVEEGRIELDAPVARYVPAFGQNGKGAITIRQLLSHTGGLRAFYPFHTRGAQTPDDVRRFIYADAPQHAPGTRVRYSDFDMIVLADVVEAVAGQPFGAYLAARVFGPLGMTRTDFRPTSGVPTTGERAPSVAPTEHDRTWRRRVMQGEVHDEAAWLLGGTAGHAGLFSTADDLARFAFALTRGGEAYGARLFAPATLRQFTTRVPLAGDYPMALGWMLRPTDGSASSSGEHFGPRAFGHTGFTGTSIWIDPDQDLFVVLLSNRVHPSRENTQIRAVRRQLADAVALAIETPPGAWHRHLGFGPVPPDLTRISDL